MQKEVQSLKVFIFLHCSYNNNMLELESRTVHNPNTDTIQSNM